MSTDDSESSGSASPGAEKHSDEQEQDEFSESPIGCNQSPDVNSKAVASAEDCNDMSFINAQSPEVTSHTTDSVNDGLLEKDENGAKNDTINVKAGYITDGLRNVSEKLSAALVNASSKEDLVKLHAVVTEEAISGWEKAENEVAGLNKQLEALALKNSALEDRVNHLDGALKECVGQLTQTKEEQKQNIHHAVFKKIHDLESSKIKLENQLIELQSKLDASSSYATSTSSIDLDMCQKVEFLEEENMALKHELLAQSKVLEIRTIERDLSTRSAEMASKQYLESINKVAKLEAECRRLKNIACRASLVNDHKSLASSSFCVESLRDRQSDSGENLIAVETDTLRKRASEPDKSELSCSDSWASALIAELDQFKNEKCRQVPFSSVKIDLMDDFLEMERLAALHDNKNQSFSQESVFDDQCISQESYLRLEAEIMKKQMDDLKEKLGNAKADKHKAELKLALMKSEECTVASQLQLRNVETKLDVFQRELENANKSKQTIENQLMTMEAEAQSITAKVQLLEAEVDKEREISVEIATNCKELEEEIEGKKQEEKLWSIASSCSEMRIKQDAAAPSTSGRKAC